MTAPTPPAPAPADDPAQTLEDVLQQLQAILDGAQGRDLSEDEVQRYEALEAKMQRMQRTEEIRKRNAAYRAVPAGQLVHVGTPKADDTLERAFEHYLRTGKENADLVQLRAQSEGTGSEGGYLVPEGFRDKLVERMKAFGGLANVADSVTTATGNPLPWVTQDDTANTGEIVEENGTFVGGADLAWGSKTLSAYSYMSGGAGGNPLRVPRELLQDAAIDVQGRVSAALGTRIARIQAPHLITGTGVKQPEGIIHGVTGVEIASHTAGLTYNDLVHFIHSIDPWYRDNGTCRWGFNDKSLEMVRKMTDSNGDPIWRPLTADMSTALGGGELMGYPVVIDQGFPDFVANDNTVNWGVFGDLNAAYVVRRVQDLEVLVNPYNRQAYRQVEFTAWARMDACIQDPNAYVALTGEA